MYRFLLSPRWLAVSVLALLAVPFCIFMGSWQLSRFEVRVDHHKSAEHAQGQAAADPPVPLASLLPDPRTQVTDDAFGHTVRATGTYDTGHQLLVPGRTLDGRTGYYVLTPLRVGGGAALPVVRGWLPGDASAAARAGSVPAAPSGRVTVTGAVQYPETSGSDGVPASGALPPGQLGVISAASLVNVVPYPVYSGWITDAAPAAPLKAVPVAASPDSGLDIKAFQNLGYTGEWFVFAGFVVFMWFRLARREAETRADAALGLGPDGAEGEGGPATAVSSPPATASGAADGAATSAGAGAGAGASGSAGAGAAAGAESSAAHVS